MPAVPKPPARVKSKRKGIARIGRVAIRYERECRQPFLAAMFMVGEVTTEPTRVTLRSGATLLDRQHPSYTGGGEVIVERREPGSAPEAFRAGAEAARVWWHTDGHVHHMEGRNHGRREDKSNLVLLSTAAHRKEHQT